MMAAGVLLMLLLELSCIDGQGYTEVYDWPGPEIIPNDGRMFISDGRVLVQLSTNGTIREARIREQVNITFDCGPHIDAVIAGLGNQTIPAGFTPRTTWYSVIRETNDTFNATNNTVQETAEIAIFGDNMRFLQIHTPLISVPAKVGNAGLYTCEFCYEFNLPLGGGRGVTCAQSDTDVNIRGDPPVIDRGFTPPDGNILIGTTICRPVDEVTVVCPQNGTTRPVGTANYLIDGMPIDLDNSLTFLRESRVTAAIDDRVSIFVSDFPATFEGVFTCNLTNVFGFDMERSLILLSPTVSSFDGTIQGTASTNCPSGTPANTICPIIGQTVNINCASNGPFNSINITDPNGVLIATNSTSFMVDSGTPLGNYSCTAFNDCGMQTRTVTVQQCLPPTITRFGPRRGDNTPLPDICYPTTIVGLRSSIIVDCQGTNVVTFEWFLNGVQLSYTFPDLPGSFITAAGNLTCVQTNACGSVSNTVHFPNEPPNINNQSGQITDISNPVLPGQTVCTDPSGSGEITLQCPLSNFDTNLRSTISWTSNGGTLASSMTPDDGDTLTVSVNATGTYTCLAENDCGSESASVTVVSPVPIITTVLRRGDNSTVDPSCVRSDNDLFIDCNEGSGPPAATMFMWFIDDILQIGANTRTIQVTTAGNYTCTLANTCNSDTARLLIRMTPEIAEASGDLVVSPGSLPVTVGNNTCISGSMSSVMLQCPLGDAMDFVIQPVTRSWVNAVGDVLSSDETITVTTEGVYNCTLSNECGSNTASTNVIRSPEILNNTGHNTQDIVNIGETIRGTEAVGIRCSISAGSGTLIRSWSQNGVPLPNTEETLVISTLNVNDVFTCTISNECGSASATSTVDGRPVITLVGSVQGITGDGCTPSTNGKKICANVRSIVTLSCSSTDHDYTIIGPNFQSHNKSLTFTVNSNDYGAYICISTNPCGVSTSYIQLDKPSISIPPSGVSITPIYETITLACSADGATHYQWTDLTTGEIISNNSIHYITAEYGKINGQYQCVTSNEAGSDTAVIKGLNSFTCGNKITHN